MHKCYVGVDETAQHRYVQSDEVDHAEYVITTDVHSDVGDEYVLFVDGKKRNDLIS